MKNKLTLLIIIVSFLYAQDHMLMIEEVMDTSKIQMIETQFEFINNDIDSLNLLSSEIKILLEHKVDKKYFENQLKQIENDLKSLILVNIEDVDDLYEKLDHLKNNLSDITYTINEIDSKYDLKLNEFNKNIDSIYSEIKTINNNINGLNKTLLTKANSSQILEIEGDIHQKVLYWLISILLLLLILLVLFIFFRLKILKQKDSLSDIINAQNKLHEQSIELDEKMISILEKQMDESNFRPSTDHSLPLKVANEIQRIRNRIKYMDAGDHSTKVIIKRIESLEEEIKKHNYDIIQLEGKDYIEGMRIHANFINDKNLSANEQIISRVIKPQVNYKGQILQIAEAEVKINN